MTYDYIVIGAGIAGCALAYQLAPSARACIVEAGSRPGLHATGRSAALYAPSYGGWKIRALPRASRAFFDDPPAGFAEYPLLRKRGALHIARSDSGAPARVATAYSARRQWRMLGHPCFCNRICRRISAQPM